MELLFKIYAICVAVAIVGVLLAILRRALLERRDSTSDEALRERYLRIVMDTLLSDKDFTPRFPAIRRAGARLLLAEVIAGLVSVTYGLDPTPLQRIVERYRLSDYLLRRIRFSRGNRRAFYLSLLGRMPGREGMGCKASQYASSDNRYVRFYTLLAQLSCDSSITLQRLSEYPWPFSAYEVSEIMTMFRRGALPVCYEPLITSPIRNLRVVGLGVVRQFGIEEAERHLLRIVAEEGTPDVAREALYALCALHCPLQGRGVIRRISKMTPAERKALLRYMALEGYAPQALNNLLDKRDYPYYESLVLSYKSCLVC